MPQVKRFLRIKTKACSPDFPERGNTCETKTAVDPVFNARDSCGVGVFPMWKTHLRQLYKNIKGCVLFQTLLP